MIRHVVVWSMRADQEERLDGLLADLRALPEQIEEIQALSCGPLVNDGPYDAALCVDVADDEALAAYRSHPLHQPVLVALREAAAEIVVGDYVI